MRIRTLLAATLLTSAPATGTAQQSPAANPLPFLTVTQSWAVSGCAAGRVTSQGPVITNLVCLSGRALLGTVQPAIGGQMYRFTLELTGTRAPEFTNAFASADYSALLVPVVFQRIGASSVSGTLSPIIDVDPTGFHSGQYFLPVDASVTTLAAGGATLGPTGRVFLAYYYADLPRAAGPVTLAFDVAVTAIPEPSTIVLTLGGLAVLGARAWRRRVTRTT